MAKLKDVVVQAGGSVKDIFMCPPALICEESGWNVRAESPDYLAGILELAESIRELGVLEPLTVYRRGEDIVLTNGHRRFSAINLLLAEGVEIKSIPVRLEEKGTNEADRVLSMITRNSGKPLTPLELSVVVKRLLGYGWNTKEISKKTQFSPSYIDSLLQLSSAPEALKSLVKDGQISGTTAISEIKRVGDVEATKNLTKAVKKVKAKGGDKVTAKHLPKKMVKCSCPKCGNEFWR